MKYILDVSTALIIYDGECGLCNELKIRVAYYDKRKKLKFVPYQKYDKISKDLTSKSIYLITGDKQIFNGIKAILVSMLYLKGNLKIIANILLKCKIDYLLEPFYLLVAKFRGTLSKLFGYNACLI
ncbi:MAG: thiol-disulfide oxidoreductase DCC family protein [Candidatus Hodarchaeales archaeon]